MLQRMRAWLRTVAPAANLGLKAMSLVLAFGLWLFVISQEKSSIALTVPLEVVNTPPGLALAGPVPETVSVSLRGTRNTLERITPADVGVHVDLARAQEGEQIELLDSQNVRAPFGVDVERIQPPQLIIRLESVVESELPILPNLTGSLPPGHTIEETTVEPTMARVRGPRNILEEIPNVSTQPVPLSGRQNSFSITVRVLSPRAEVEIVGPETANVKIRIAERRESRTLTVPVETGGEAQGRVLINPRFLPVTVQGPASQIDSLQTSDLRVAVEVGGLEPSDEDYHLAPEVTVRRPEALPGVELLSLGQPRIDVHVYPVPEE